MPENKKQNIKKKAPYIVGAVLLIIGAFVAFNMAETGPGKTSVDTAKVWVKAMIASDPEVMDKINHSEFFAWPTQHLMNLATEDNWGQYDLKDFKYTDLGDGRVEVAHPELRTMILTTTKENGRWYFVDMDIKN